MLWWHVGWEWWASVGVVIVLVCTCGFVLATIVALITPLKPSERSHNGGRDVSAGEILSRRLARGEITRKECRHRMAALGLDTEAPDNPSRKDGSGHKTGSASGE